MTFVFLFVRWFLTMCFIFILSIIYHNTIQCSFVEMKTPFKSCFFMFKINEMLNEITKKSCLPNDWYFTKKYIYALKSKRQCGAMVNMHKHNYKFDVIILLCYRSSYRIYVSVAIPCLFLFVSAWMT